MRESFAAFKELVAKFPDSRYAQDAIDRMRYLTNALALYEVKVAQLLLQPRRLRRRVNRAQAAIVELSAHAGERRRARRADGELRQARARRSCATTRSAILRPDLPDSTSRRDAVTEVLARSSWSDSCLVGARVSRVSPIRAKNASTSASSRVRRIGGRLRQIRLP